MTDIQPQSGLSLTRVDAGLATLRTMMINIGFFAATLLLVPTMGAQIIRNPIIIEPIAVPQALADQLADRPDHEILVAGSVVLLVEKDSREIRDILRDALPPAR